MSDNNTKKSPNKEGRPKTLSDEQTKINILDSKRKWRAKNKINNPPKPRIYLTEEQKKINRKETNKKYHFKKKKFQKFWNKILIMKNQVNLKKYY